MLRLILVAVEAILVLMFAADAVFGLTHEPRLVSVALAAGFALILAWDVRR